MEEIKNEDCDTLESKIYVNENHVKIKEEIMYPVIHHSIEDQTEVSNHKRLVITCLCVPLT